MFKTQIFIITLFIFTSIFAIRENKLPSLNFLIKNSSHIVMVKLTDKKSFEGKNSIYTNYDFIVLQSFKGTLQKETHIDLTFPGGRVGKRFSMTHSLPSYNKSEQYLLFLNEDKNKLELFQGYLGSFFYSEEDKTFFNTIKNKKFFINDLINTISETGNTK